MIEVHDCLRAIGRTGDDLAPERKRVVAREMLRRRRHDAREAWLTRHGFVAAIVAAFPGLTAFFVGKRNRTS